jgi:hypothetical protein
MASSAGGFNLRLGGVSALASFDFAQEAPSNVEGLRAFDAGWLAMSPPTRLMGICASLRAFDARWPINIVTNINQFTDLSIIKNVTIQGTARAQLRLEVFNLFDQANFGQPGRIAIPGSAAFGQITNTRFPTGDSGSARQVQLAVKFLF